MQHRWQPGPEGWAQAIQQIPVGERGMVSSELTIKSSQNCRIRCQPRLPGNPGASPVPPHHDVPPRETVLPGQGEGGREKYSNTTELNPS